MKCPHCSSLLGADAAVCGACGFSSRTVRSLLGGDWVRLERITDSSRRLSLRETRHLETCLDDFERTFPQCFFAIYLGPLPDSMTSGDLGFWMLNHGAFQNQRLCKRNEFGIALVVDTLGLCAALTVGYALEPFLPAASLERTLQNAAPKFRRGALADAIEVMVRHASGNLRRAARRAPLMPDDGPAVTAEAGALGFEPLRNKHRHDLAKDEKNPR